jgi:superfamily II DNA/RNA helicase
LRPVVTRGRLFPSNHRIFYVDFNTFSFDDRIMAGIRSAAYVTPTPIQEQAIAPVLKGRDVLGLAQTGTGKTAAFALPLLQRLLDADAGKRGPVRVLVLAPTRELALQIHESFVTLGRQTGIRSAAVFGGVGVNPQVKALRQATVAVACPGRLLDLINRGEADVSQVESLVLDEADHMLDMGFLPDLRKILAKLPTRRQNLLFSATMPGEIRSLAESILRDPEEVQVANTAPPKRISHALYPVPSHLKTGLLETFLKGNDHQSVLVFTRTKHRAKSLARKLEARGWQATSLQGNLSQNRRQEALDGFRTGKYRIMVATDIAARGIDCSRVSHVVNFDIPDTVETYTHRIGRTGRAERSGSAMTMVTEDDMGQVRAIERVMRMKIDRVRIDGFDYDQAAPKGMGKEDKRFERDGVRRAGGAGRGGSRGGARAGQGRGRSGSGNTSSRRSGRSGSRAA